MWLTAVIALAVMWAAFALRDNVLLIREYRSTPPANEFRMLADYLVAHRITYGYATTGIATSSTFSRASR